jgi:hypothetical protein
VVKYFSSTGELPPILVVSRKIGADGTEGGAVKCVEIFRNSDGEGSPLDLI